MKSLALQLKCTDTGARGSMRISTKKACAGNYTFLHMYSCGKINATFDFLALRSFSVGGASLWNYLHASGSQAVLGGW